jgi:hypothetical protein
MGSRAGARRSVRTGEGLRISFGTREYDYSDVVLALPKELRVGDVVKVPLEAEARLPEGGLSLAGVIFVAFTSRIRLRVALVTLGGSSW